VIDIKLIICIQLFRNRKKTMSSKELIKNISFSEVGESGKGMTNG